jgi:hypothetical protein
MFIILDLELGGLSLNDSRPSLRAGGIVEGGDYCVIPYWGSQQQYINPVRRFAPAE